MNTLKSVSDAELLTTSEKLRAQEREIQAKFLRYLCEIERRKLYLGLGFTSLFAMLIGYYHFDQTAAFLRLNSVKALRDLPEAEHALKEGSVNMSTLSEMQSFAKKAEIRDGAKAELFEQIKNKSQKSCEKLFAEMRPEVNLIPDRERQLSPQHVELKGVVSPELLQKIEKIKNLRPGHAGSYEEILTYMADQVLKQIDPAREPARKVISASKARHEVKVSSAAEPNPDRRRPTARQRREVYQKGFQAGCAYVDPKSGRRCGSRFALQVDHAQPYALGGATAQENLRLLCQAHHQWVTRQVFERRASRQNKDVT